MPRYLKKITRTRFQRGVNLLFLSCNTGYCHKKDALGSKKKITYIKKNIMYMKIMLKYKTNILVEKQLNKHTHHKTNIYFCFIYETIYFFHFRRYFFRTFRVIIIFGSLKFCKSKTNLHQFCR